MSMLDRWLLRIACAGVILLALYGYSWVLLDQYGWRVQVTQVINALGQAAKLGGPSPVPRPMPPEPPTPK
jgi:hypothetical protein